MLPVMNAPSLRLVGSLSYEDARNPRRSTKMAGIVMIYRCLGHLDAVASFCMENSMHVRRAGCRTLVRRRAVA
jgi:hypothetical protein